ncbi:hypothetical protein FJ364_00165 [Candidatus Dependentiae bacterium]|nr:hypothetical protein [Candidatus Dependentiae bacterium]
MKKSIIFLFACTISLFTTKNSSHAADINMIAVLDLETVHCLYSPSCIGFYKQALLLFCENCTCPCSTHFFEQLNMKVLCTRCQNIAILYKASQMKCSANGTAINTSYKSICEKCIDSGSNTYLSLLKDPYQEKQQACLCSLLYAYYLQMLGYGQWWTVCSHCCTAANCFKDERSCHCSTHYVQKDEL